jgi:hypothetical protein
VTSKNELIIRNIMNVGTYTYILTGHDEIIPHLVISRDADGHIAAVPRLEGLPHHLRIIILGVMAPN